MHTLELRDRGQQGEAVTEPLHRAPACGVTLKEDIACFYRGISPYNALRTVTICNGMFARGTLGAVRTLTDRRFRDRNEGYINERFAQPPYGILSRVAVVGGETSTPDWTDPHVRLFEWSGDTS